MQLAIDDKCQEELKHLKFDKNIRFIVYKIQDEHIVKTLWSRSLKMWERDKKIGKIFWQHFPKKNTDIAPSISNTLPMTVCMLANYSFAIGLPMLHPLSREFFTPPQKKISGPI